MNLLIQGVNNFNVSERLKSYIGKRTEKLSYFKNHINEIHFHITEEKHEFKIDVNLSLRKLGSYKFETKDKDLHSAIDKIVHKIDVKINREKSKIQDHSKASHEEVVQFFYEHEENMPEPTTEIEVDTKPTTLVDAYLMLKDESTEFIGFYLVNKEDNNSVAFLRKVSEDVFYLLSKKDDKSYTEYSLKVSATTCEIDKEIRSIDLPKFNLLAAQKDILDNDFHFDLFANSANNKISLLYKEGNGKWFLLS
ncbi:MAG: ribosomal subunit interface protein [Spirochaetes bacterium GWC1_27_15]|nr:MAG: ribosomal subunit interface protein [Spirochaetes bacterium GWB1_27_13]OHD28298.1 MAG: ribosomal subunit interface protein [Spirochaetes bacterium GWC1_27_15]